MSAAITNGEIREALAQAVGQVPGINVYRYPPDNVTVPCVMISGLSMKPITFDGNRETTIDVIVLVSRRSVDQMAGLDQLLDADDPSSVITAIEDANPAGVAAVSSQRLSLRLPSQQQQPAKTENLS